NTSSRIGMVRFHIEVSGRQRFARRGGLILSCGFSLSHNGQAVLRPSVAYNGIFMKPPVDSRVRGGATLVRGDATRVRCDATRERGDATRVSGADATRVSGNASEGI